MRQIKYFLQFFLIFFLFLIFKLLGIKISLLISSFIFKNIGPFFKSKSVIESNLSIVFPKLTKDQKENIINKMWANYGKIFAEYIFLKKFRTSQNYQKKITIENQEILEKIKIRNKPVIFISGHFNNFELMAMYIEKSGIDLAAIYRPLNNKFLNPIMEKIRKKYICRKQIKKGISGTKELLKEFKNGTSIALMIDQRVSEGLKCSFFNREALTTTIPAQFVKKYGASIVPVYIERSINDDFKLKILNEEQFAKEESIDEITLKLNKILEKMVVTNPNQWIWTHNRWKI